MKNSEEINPTQKEEIDLNKEGAELITEGSLLNYECNEDDDGTDWET